MHNDATYQQCHEAIAEALGRPARRSESVLWDTLSLRQRNFLLRSCGLSPAECGYTFEALSIADRHLIMKNLTEWLGTVADLRALQRSVTAEQLADHWELVRGQDADPRLREYWRGKGEQPPRERAA